MALTSRADGITRGPWTLTFCLQTVVIITTLHKCCIILLSKKARLMTPKWHLILQGQRQLEELPQLSSFSNAPLTLGVHWDSALSISAISYCSTTRHFRGTCHPEISPPNDHQITLNINRSKVRQICSASTPRGLTFRSISLRDIFHVPIGKK